MDRNAILLSLKDTEIALLRKRADLKEGKCMKCGSDYGDDMEDDDMEDDDYEDDDAAYYDDGEDDGDDD